MQLIEQLWKAYTDITPSAGKIHRLFEARGEKIVNDHIALRTFNDPRCNIDVLSQPFRKLGYEPAGEYDFDAKKLKAQHFHIPGNSTAPKVFISQLLVGEFSPALQQVVREALDSASQDRFNDAELVLQGRIWPSISHQTYEQLRTESEYAAWMYAYGFRVNHFTVFVNHLKSFDSLQEVNGFLEKSGFKLNESGGKIKGSPKQLLEQSSTLADLHTMDFADGTHRIPSCYYEFARRYPQQDGQLYGGFIAASADKIFESTDLRHQQ